MRKTIGVIGLASNKNAGDYLLVEAAQYLLRAHDPDLSIKTIDVDPRGASVYRGKRRLNLMAFELMLRFERPVLSVLRGQFFSYWYHYLLWHAKLNWHLDEQLKNIDAVVIAGGGFIKFKTQGLNFLDEMILRIAERRGIPVMMNAVGVEGYSETDMRCQRLKRALNAGAVRVITTRDDIDTLNEHYITNKQIVTERVGDPVFWLREMGMVDAAVTKTAGAQHRIGINLVNPNNFSGYGGRVSRIDIINFYRNLITELRERGADFSLFSNGMDVDERFGAMLVDDLGLRPDQLLPAPVTSGDLVNTIAGFDIILSARMHAGITAYALDVPVVGLIWGEKLQFLTEITGLRDRYFDETELDHERIVDMLMNNDLPVPDARVREELRQRTRDHLARFADSIGAGGAA